jgi:hypothetical protein
MIKVYRLDAAGREAVTAKLAAELQACPGVAFAMLHGSFMRGDAFRDVDIAVWTQPDADRFLDLDLATQLSRLTGLPVDARRINDAPLAFRFRALQGRILAVTDERFLADLMETTARAYHDQATLRERALREAFSE